MVSNFKLNNQVIDAFLAVRNSKINVKTQNSTQFSQNKILIIPTLLFTPTLVYFTFRIYYLGGY